MVHALFDSKQLGRELVPLNICKNNFFPKNKNFIYHVGYVKIKGNKH
jgi:hypothetical protein